MLLRILREVAAPVVNSFSKGLFKLETVAEVSFSQTPCLNATSGSFFVAIFVSHKTVNITLKLLGKHDKGYFDKLKFGSLLFHGKMFLGKFVGNGAQV